MSSPPHQDTEASYRILTTATPTEDGYFGEIFVACGNWPTALRGDVLMRTADSITRRLEHAENLEFSILSYAHEQGWPVDGLKDALREHITKLAAHEAQDAP